MKPADDVNMKTIVKTMESTLTGAWLRDLRLLFISSLFLIYIRLYVSHQRLICQHFAKKCQRCIIVTKYTSAKLILILCRLRCRDAPLMWWHIVDTFRVVTSKLYVNTGRLFPHPCPHSKCTRFKIHDNYTKKKFTNCAPRKPQTALYFNFIALSTRNRIQMSRGFKINNAYRVTFHYQVAPSRS